MAQSQGFFDSWLLYKEKISWGLLPAPDPTKTRAILCNGASWGSSASKLDVLLSEINQEYGYSRYTWSPVAADITFDAIDKRVEIAEATWSQTATGGAIQWNGVAILANADAVANRLITSINAATSTFTLSAHGRVNGDQLIITADPNGTLAGGLPTTPAIVYVVEATTNTFKASLTLGGSPITLTNAGIAPMRVRYANGEIVAGYRDTTSSLIPSGATRQFNWNFSHFNSAAAVGTTW
ncbi:hypothetical protein [Coleofasciculus sp. FACHB-T130]|uniref:hypothetical protein n=1 Tax=Cyanophyceae TaxID=3028117 RepID=UPI001682F292|nr:hypothetical protein [Coleofasciculus sp. FACHB-T130]MBD1878382.1 hypothetical protein [Coleofasciculus sp. FACHB-T130]